jgi:hypothetical protein
VTPPSRASPTRSPSFGASASGRPPWRCPTPARPQNCVLLPLHKREKTRYTNMFSCETVSLLRYSLLTALMTLSKRLKAIFSAVPCHVKRGSRVRWMTRSRVWQVCFPTVFPKATSLPDDVRKETCSKNKEHLKCALYITHIIQPLHITCTRALTTLAK